MNNIDNQKLMDYLSGKLSAEEQHEVERWMLDNPFEAEALEGLQHSGSGNIQHTVDQLNSQLKKHLKEKKLKRRRKLNSSGTWTYLAVILILLLAVLVYLVIRRIQ